MKTRTLGGAAAVAVMTSTIASPSPDLANHLHGVTCIATNSCVAVGFRQPRESLPRNLIETWNGTSWAITPSPKKRSSVSNC
jgi:hypothetical protein